MTLIADRYFNTYVKIKYFLSSYRALSDGQSGINSIEAHILENRFMLWQWKVLWIGTCSILRTSIDLFKVDIKSCINSDIRDSIKEEWANINKNRDDHCIFWNFLKLERDNIIHGYRWQAYEAWMDADGNHVPAGMTSLFFGKDDRKLVLLMRDGPYKGKDSLDLLKEGANWVEKRIINSIERAGFDPEEERNLRTFKIRDPDEYRRSRTLLSDALRNSSASKLSESHDNLSQQEADPRKEDDQL